jgi:hypothetical protein
VLHAAAIGQLFTPSSRYANSTPPAVIVRVGTFCQLTVTFCAVLMLLSVAVNVTPVFT